jgi:two-component system, chemotaxis family, protein-glutamate methylesterase/glutaminase
MIKVLIADDSPTLRVVVRTILESDPGLKVVGEAANGWEACERCKALLPDIVTMDIRMPLMNGYEAIARIMDESPRPIVVLTSTQSDLELGITFKAIEAGALMVIRKPQSVFNDARVKADLIAQVKAMANVKVVGRHRRFYDKTVERSCRPAHPGTQVTARQLVVIGVSTGGPPALQTILKQLPADFPMPVAVVQHISKGFVSGLASWLDSVVPMRVKVAESGELLAPGRVYLAPDDQHLTVDESRRTVLKTAPAVDGHRPSATVLLESAARSFGPAVIGLLLTGMGRDGAEGLRQIYQAGGCTLAQDEATSVVFGMPKVAIEMGAAGEVLPLEKIAGRLMEKIVHEKRQSEQQK